MMKTVYFIYVSIPQKIFDSKIKFLLSNTEDFRFKRNTMYGLYAWSTKKKIVKEFFELREPKIYTLVEKEIDSEEYFEHFKSKYSNLELKIREYDRKDGANLKTTEIVTTKNKLMMKIIIGHLVLHLMGTNIVLILLILSMFYYIFFISYFMALKFRKDGNYENSFVLYY